MASSSFQALALCLFLLCGSCLASRQSSSRPAGQQAGQQMGFSQGECNIQNLNPLEPSHRIQHEAGVSEVWDENNQQLQCAGVAVTRHVIENRGLLLPSFNNAPMLIFVVQGHGTLGVMYPGCPETYQSFEQPQQETEETQHRGQRFRDQHQKIHRFWPGDVIALPAGVAHWAYNEGVNEQQLVLLVVHDISNKDNQLDQNLRRFFLAGNQQGRQQGSWQAGEQKGFNWNNVFQAMDVQLLAQVFGVNTDLIRRLQGENDNRGHIVRVQNGLRLLRPRSEQRQQGQGQGQGGWTGNGYEETICTMRLRENLISPESADIYTARGGGVSTVNSFNLPILRHLQLSAGRGSLRPNAMIAPYWNINAHSITYVTRGSGRLQVVGNSRRPVYDGEIRQGQLFIVPQNFVHLKQAGSQGLEWFTAKTNDLAKSSSLAGRTSVIRAMPVDVLMNTYQLTREEAEALKFNREEVTVLSPQMGSQSQQPGSPWSIVG